MYCTETTQMVSVSRNASFISHLMQLNNNPQKLRMSAHFWSKVLKPEQYLEETKLWSPGKLLKQSARTWTAPWRNQGMVSGQIAKAKYSNLNSTLKKPRYIWSPGKLLKQSTQTWTVPLRNQGMVSGQIAKAKYSNLNSTLKKPRYGLRANCFCPSFGFSRRASLFKLIPLDVFQTKPLYSFDCKKHHDGKN